MFASQRPLPTYSAEALLRAREDHIIARWIADGPNLLNRLCESVIDPSHSSGFRSAQRALEPAVRQLRDRLIPLIFEGRALFEELPRGERVQRIDRLQLELCTVVRDSAKINCAIVREWCRNSALHDGQAHTSRPGAGQVELPLAARQLEAQLEDRLAAVELATNTLLKSLEIFRNPAEETSVAVDLIDEAQRVFPPTVSWFKIEGSTLLTLHCRRAALLHLFSEITRVLEGAIAAQTQQNIRAIFRDATEDGFADQFQCQQERIRAAVVYRPAITASLLNGRSLVLSLAIAPELRDSWSICLTDLNRELRLAQALAQLNALRLTVSLGRENSALDFAIQLPDDPRLFKIGYSDPPRQCSITHRNPQTDVVQFPFRIVGESRTQIVQVQTQRAPFMSAAGILSLDRTMAAMSVFTAHGRRSWQQFSCEANCPIAMNRDSFEQGYFEIRLTDRPPVIDRSAPVDPAALCRFDWEKPAETSLQAYDRYCRKGAPEWSSIVMPADAFCETDIQLDLHRLLQRFSRVDFDMSLRGSFADFYLPDERVVLARFLLRQLTDRFVENQEFAEHSLRIVPWHTACVADIGKESELFRVEIFDPAGALILCGALASTTFEFKWRSHCEARERLALERLQSALSEEKDPVAALGRKGLVLNYKAQEILRQALDPKRTLRLSAEIDALIKLCRDPWYDLGELDGKLFLLDHGHPPTPQTAFIYGELNEFGGQPRPIFCFRYARNLFVRAEAGLNGNRTFYPNDAFRERMSFETELKLELD